MTRRRHQSFRDEVFTRDGHVCVYCSVPISTAAQDRDTPRYGTLDHVVPISKGGRSTPHNLVTSCLACNRDKADRQLPPGFLRKLTGATRLAQVAYPTVPALEARATTTTTTTEDQEPRT